MREQQIFLTKSQFTWAESQDHHSEHMLSAVCIFLYRFKFMRYRVIRFISNLEGGNFFSKTRRKILFRFHGALVGRYSYGSCLSPGILPNGTVVGNYCSFAENLKVFRRNHALRSLSQHPFFYNKQAGLLSDDRIESVQENPLIIGHDVWIGADVIILPGCKEIGNGAVIGAGSVVTKDIPPYAIAAGNPAKIIRFRYDEAEIALLEASKWWEKPLSTLLKISKLPFEEVNVSALEALSKECSENANAE